jgi:hypothetical protein
MKKYILAIVVAALASMAIISSASAGVERYQTQSMTITAVQPEGAYHQWENVWTHTYNVTLNPCDGSFSGDGSQVGDINGPYGTQTVTGHLDGNTVSLTASRSDGITWAMTGEIGDTLIATLRNADGSVLQTPDAVEFKVSKTMGASSNFKNHGEYVSSMGGGDDAAHSCIGMPIKASK